MSRANSEIENKNRADGHCRPGCQKLGAHAGDDVLLVDQRRYELEPVPPHHALLVVTVGPEGMQNVVGAGGHVSVIAEEAAAETITGVNVLSGHGLGDPSRTT
jgi:hypothetical protein